LQRHCLELLVVFYVLCVDECNYYPRIYPT